MRWLLAIVDQGGEEGSGLAWVMSGMVATVALLAAVAICGLCDPEPKEDNYHHHHGVLHPPPEPPRAPGRDDQRSIPPHQPPPHGRVQMPRGNNDTELQLPENAKVKDVMQLLHKICEVFHGRIQTDQVISRESIREGTWAAVATVEAVYGGAVTVAFFPDQYHKRKHMRLYEVSGMKGVMPTITDEKDEFIYRDATGSVRLPPHIQFENSIPVRNYLAKVLPQERPQEMFHVLQSIARVVDAMHRKKLVLRDLSIGNVVRTTVGAQVGWSLLEFTSYTRVDKKEGAVPFNIASPEMAQSLWEGTPVNFTHAFDMWSLGLLIYEVVQGEPYWGTETANMQILEQLRDPEAKLPHQVRPLMSGDIQNIVSKLLCRDPGSRIDSIKLSHHIEQLNAQEYTLNEGKVVTEERVTLDT